MHKGYKNGNKGMAVLRFFIGLIGLAIVVCIIYFFLSRVDYSDKLANADASMRPYVETTATPQVEAAVSATVQSSEEVIDLTVTETPEATATATPEPTATPSPTPIPTPTPSPTPVPTKIPSSSLSAMRTSGFKVPDPSDNAQIGLTDFYVSSADNNAVVRLLGYGYIVDPSFDGSKSQLFLIVTRTSTGDQIAYQCNMSAGITGVDHSDAVCANAASTDFEACLDVSKYPDGEYKMGVIIYYELNSNKAYSYHEFTQTFTVTSGQISNAPTIGADSAMDFTVNGPDASAASASATATIEPETTQVG